MGMHQNVQPAMAKAILDPADPAFISDEDRVNSPHNLLDAHRVFNPPPRESKRTLSFSKQQESNDDAAEKRVTIWNWKEQRKLSGNSAPFKKNLQEYIRKHPDWEEYVGQDKDITTGKKLSPKKMLPPAPRDRNHPYYSMSKAQLAQHSAGIVVTPISSPVLPSSQSSSYGTRSSQTRTIRDSPVPAVARVAVVAASKPTYSATAAQVLSTINPALLAPMNIVLESPAVVASRRSLEMAARRKAMEAEGSSVEAEESREKSDADAEDDAEAKRVAAWKAASEIIAEQEAKNKAAKRKLEDELHQSRLNAHAEQQSQIAGSAMSRILAFKKRRVHAPKVA